jgi:chromosome segregation ATPase
LCAAASEKNDQLEETLSLMRRHARDDRVAIEEKDAQIADLEERKHALEERLDASLQEITSLKNRISVLEAEQDMRAQMLALMKEAFTNQDPPMA